MRAPKILIVDNERSIRQAICFELEEAGYDVIHASDYEEAMALYNVSGADMIITDIFLERGTGIDLVEQIKMEKEEMPFIFITAFPETALGEHVKSIYKEQFYEKPFYMDKLTNQVNDIFKNKSIQFARQ